MLLVARNKAGLDLAASEIRMASFLGGPNFQADVVPETKHPRVSTRVHSIDFSTHNEVAYKTLSATLKGLDIGVLGEWFASDEEE